MGNIPSSSRFLQGNASSAEKLKKNIAEGKKKRPCETRSSTGQRSREQLLNDAMANAMLDMVAASKLRAVAKCVKQWKTQFTINGFLTPKRRFVVSSHQVPNGFSQVLVSISCFVSVDRLCYHLRCSNRI